MLGRHPTGWREVLLSSVAYFQEGPGLRNWLYRQTGMPFINIRCIKNGKLDLSAVQYIDLETAEKTYSHFFLQEGDTVLSSSGTLGRMAVVSEEDLPLMLNTSVVRFRTLDEQSLNTEFMRCCLLSPDFQCQIARESQGSAQANFGPSHLKKVHIPLPPLPEQRKIAAILSSVDEAIQATQAVIEQTRRVKEGLLQELLTKGIGHTRFKQTEIGQIPEEWEVRSLGSVSTVVRGSTPRPAKDPRYFDGKDTPWITVGVLAQDDSPFLNSTPTFLTAEGAKRSRPLRAGTVVLSNSGFGCGVPKILAIDGCANDGVAAFLNLSASLNPLFLYYYLRSRTLWLRHEVARGVDQPNLNTTLISEVPIPIPPLDEQARIVQVILSLDEKLTNAAMNVSCLRHVKSGLLQDLLTGRVRVSV